MDFLILIPFLAFLAIPIVLWLTRPDSMRSNGNKRDFKHLAEVEDALKREYDAQYKANLASAKQKYEDELVKLKHQYSGSSKVTNGFEGEFIRNGLESIGTWCKGMIAVGGTPDEKEFQTQTVKFDLLKSILAVYFDKGTEEYNSFSKIFDETRSLLLQIFRGVKDAKPST
jgi:hypothetical protein